MDNRSIFSKTGKGSLEISKKTIKLSSEERQALILVDGKTNFGELQEKLSRVSPPKLRAVFEKLIDLELIREFVAKNDPPAAPPPVGDISVRELGGGSDLDFTALAPAPLADPAKELEARRRAAAEAEEEARQVREAILRKEQERKVAEEAARRAAEEEARRKAEAERLAREESARRAAEEEAQRKVEAERLAREQREREERERLERERQERERLEREEAARRAAEEEARRKAEAERVAKEQREREERERLERERQERERLEREEAARRAAEEEARRKAEAERLAREQREREERERLERERQERERLEREEAARRAAEEEARRKAEAERLAREQRDREERERLEREQQEKERLEREAAARRAEEEARRKAAAEQHAREEQELEARHKAEREKLERDRLARQQEEAEREAAAQLAARSAQAAAISTPEPASLDFNAGVKPADGGDLDFAPAAPEQRRKSEVDQLLSSPAGLDGATPLAGGGPDTFADTGSVMDPFADDDTKASKEKEVASRKEIEQEAKERAKAEARAKKEAEREAKRLAKESRVKVRGNGPSIGTIVAGLVLVSILGAVGYLLMMPIDKAAIERALSERLGEPVTVGTAKFSAFPPELSLGAVVVGPIKLNNVVARPDSTSLMSDHKIWKTVEVNGLSTNAAGARAVLALGTRDVSKIAASRTEIQRVRINDIEVTGLPVALPKFGMDVALNGTGTIKQVSLSTPDEKARVSLLPDGEKWLVDVESRGMTWPVGPKIAWDSVRGKGLASTSGIKFEEYTVTHFGGSSRGAGELSWSGNWKFSGNLDLGNLESEALAQAFYGAASVSGSVEGKLSIAMSGTALNRLFDAPQIDGAISVNKAVVKNVDLARTAQTGSAAPGSTRFTDFSATIAAAGGKLQLKDIKGVSGLLTVSGSTEVNADKTLGGNITVELGVGGSRAKATVRLSGSVAEPKLSR